LHCFAEGLEELIGLLRGKDERDDNLFFEGGISRRGFFSKRPFVPGNGRSPGDGEHMVDGDGLHGEIAPHVEEERRVEGA